jgi:hypothetical protein
MPPQPPGLAFNASQLAGPWAESDSPEPVCTSQDLRHWFEFAPDGRRLTIRFSRVHPTELGNVDTLRAAIVSSTERTFTLLYDGEPRMRSDGAPTQWELAMVAPGVYRWRDTSWPSQDVNVVVGIRCDK